jgi:cell division protease FtsH
MTKEELEYKISVLLGGRAAEQIVFHHLSTGASDDLQRVTDIARSMVTKYGMDETLGHVVYEENKQTYLDQQGHLGTSMNCSNQTAEQIDTSVRTIIDATFTKTIELLENNRDILEKCAQELLTKETLVEEELRELTKDLKRVSPNVS